MTRRTLYWYLSQYGFAHVARLLLNIAQSFERLRGTGDRVTGVNSSVSTCHFLYSIYWVGSLDFNFLDSPHISF